MVYIMEAMSNRFRRNYFHVKKEIVPFLDTHWDILWKRKKTKKWQSTLTMALSKYPRHFQRKRVNNSGYWGLNPHIQKWGWLLFVIGVERLKEE